MTFPDVLTAVVGYITPIVSPIRVVSRVPDPRPKELVQIRRVGGLAAIPVRDRARLDVFAWAQTDERAMEIALQIRTALWGMSSTSLAGIVFYGPPEEFLGPRLFDEPNTHSPRVWATYQLTVRADDVTPAPAS